MLKSRESLISVRESCAKALAAEQQRILVCAGTGCISGGSLEIFDKLQEIMKDRGIKCAVELDTDSHEHKDVGLKQSGCHGFCELGALVRIEPAGFLYTKVKLEDCEEIVDETILKGNYIDRLAYKKDDIIFKVQDEIPFYAQQSRVSLEHCGHIDANHITEYLAVGGYSAIEKAIFDMEPSGVIDEIKASGLRGRGGGGFPTGLKWGFAAQNRGDVKYIICNGDEGDPGAFMDRSIMEGDPHRLIEGMIIAGFACGASEGYIYVRAEYPMAIDRLIVAIDQAKEYNLLGENILGSDFTFNLHISRGAGAFVCGEETALIASLEGERGMPRLKPPFPAEKGFWGKPSNINNVETFANIPSIVEKGSEWFTGIGQKGNSGTKTFAITGKILNTGLIEVPMGTTLRKVIFDIGGGLRGDAEFKAVQIGGPSGGCLTKDHLDLSLDFDSLKTVGAMIGSGGLVVMDNKNCMIEVARFFMNFTQNESCGKCTHCRIGTKRMLEILTRITEGKGRDGDIELLEELGHEVQEGSLCGLGQTAPNPVLTTIKYFRNEYEDHIYNGKCTAGECEALIDFSIDPEKCIGCTLCARKCPTSCITGELKKAHVIDQENCIKCGNCLTVCKFGAVIKA